MPWAAAVAAAGTVYSASQTNKAQGAQADIANRQSAIGMEDRATYNRLYAPRQEQLLNNVFDSGKTPAAEAARAGAEASAAADTSEQITLRNARRAGVNINSPAFASLTRKSQADRAGLLSSAKTYGRRFAVDDNFNKQSTALGMGQNLTSNAINANASAAGMMQNVANQQAEQNSQTAQLAGMAAGYASSALSDYLKKKKTPNPDGTGSNVGGWGQPSSGSQLGGDLSVNYNRKF